MQTLLLRRIQFHEPIGIRLPLPPRSHPVAVDPVARRRWLSRSFVLFVCWYVNSHGLRGPTAFLTGVSRRPHMHLKNTKVPGGDLPGETPNLHCRYRFAGTTHIPSLSCCYASWQER
jgi:hypothetical protein